MNNVPYIHNPKDQNHLLKSYFIALIPLLCFGIYKNGILLYINNLINFQNILIPIYFYIISIIIGISVSIIAKEDFKENVLVCLICSASISINTNMIIYPILLFVVLFIVNYLKPKIKLTFNYTALIRIFLVLSLLLNSYSYLNIGEKLNKFNYNYFDTFIGYSVGGIATTSMLLVLFALVILSFNKFYKKEVAIFSSLSFVLISTLLLFIIKNNNLASILLNGTVYFSFIFVAADFRITPYSKKGMIIYGTIIGIVTSILSLILNFNEVGYLATLLVSLTIPLINRALNKKYLHN